jgi:hypothetical protein
MRDDMLNKGCIIPPAPAVTPIRLLLGHSKIDGIARYRGIEVDDAIEIAEKMNIRGLLYVDERILR